MPPARPEQPAQSERPEHPAALARLWRTAGPSKLGRRPELDTERVVRAAVELADRDGLDAVVMAKLARQLDVTTMALYRHVGSKDELLVLMQDLAVGEPPTIEAPTNPTTDFRGGLRRWATALREAYEAHPWLAAMTVGAPPLGPYSLAWMNLALAQLRATTLDWPEKLAIAGLLGSYVRQSARLAIDFAGTGADTPQAEAEYARSLAQLVDPATYPEVAELLAAGVLGTSQPDSTGQPDGTGQPDSAGQPDGVEDEFGYGLTVILRGITP
ncbi:TetR/AcrR family transcriptional regulator [Kribbella solani]|uniref:AcrR family transcriptional regulator n=1 Tax=Kribbella solani TaxID=236067 RepID=A0A841DH49_9ACTN|nr:TetR/AcrR family transcriptional regulator [Kribbella solani]MBB5977843.1 AcrR family transcriptional regulator [Kribbella solani]